MARAKKEAALTPEERLQAALVPDWAWPYKLPKNWCWVYAPHIFDIEYGKGLPTKQLSDTGYPVFGANGQIGFYSEYMYKEPQALMSCRGAYSGTMNKSLPYSYVTSNSLIISSPRGLMGTDCIYYLFSALNVSELISGTAQPQVTVQAFDGFPIPLSPLAEQQRIVDRIESLFAKLDEAKEKAQAVVDSFETRKAAILHKAFTGELTAKWREEHGVGMDSWEHHQFSDLCAIVRGGSPRPAGDPRYYDGNIPFMKVADITRNDSPYVSKVEYSIKEEGLKKTRMVEANTLLLTNSGATLGVPAITTIRTTFNDGIAAFIGLDIDSLLFYYYFWTSKTAFLRSINMGAAQPNLNTKLIGEVEIDVPQTAERVEIARVLNALLSKEQQAKEAAEAVLDQIDLMKKSILARAFRGELGTNDPSEESAVEYCCYRELFDRQLRRLSIALPVRPVHAARC